MSLFTALQVVWWVSLAVVVFSYLGYPLLIWAFSRLLGKKPIAPLVSDADLPPVTLLIAAHNEEKFIRERLENALASDYPADKLEILVASDGSTDATCAICREFPADRVRLLDYKQRSGKPATLNRAFGEVRHGLIAFSDANTMYDPPALKRLVRWFQDPDIGAVVGRLVLVDSETGTNVDSIYWKYETFLKKCEARLGAILGANGAIYAMRKDRMEPIPDNTIIDDFVVPLLAQIKHRFQVVYDADAVATEQTPPSIQSEFRRRTRIGTGAYQSLALLWRLIFFRCGWTSVCFVAHKLCRWVVPFFLVTLIVANLGLLSHPFYQVMLGLQAAFYLLAAVGEKIPGTHAAVKFLRLPAMFTGMNLALLFGFLKWMITRPAGVWSRTVR